MANTKISALTALTTPTWGEEFVYAYNNANWKITLNTMKSFVWWAWITTLNADANIWELTEWTYETEHQLYYKTSETIPSTTDGAGRTRKQLIFVTIDDEWVRWFLAFSWGTVSSIVRWWYASFWYSASSSDGECYRLADRQWALKQYDAFNMQYNVDALWNFIWQVCDEVYWNQELRVSWSSLYSWVVYTVYINTVQAWENYSITLWTGVANPFNITLPSNSTKKCLVTLFATSSSTAIITGCTIES